MKRTYLISYIAISALSAAHSPAQTTLAKWTFESSIPAAAGPFVPEVGSGSALGFHASASTIYSNPAGNGSAESFSSDKWAVGDYYQFQVNTVGYQGVAVSYDQASSNTGPGSFGFFYSTDGSVFTQFGGAYSVFANAAPNPTWNPVTASSLYNFSYDLTPLTALDNDNSIFFRVVNLNTVSANGGVVATAGTDRIDNFTVTATTVPEPRGLALLGLGALVGFTWFRCRL